jgi:hypothetical protein
MATNARGASNKAKNSMMAQRMKTLGIRRTSGLCPICYRMVAIPMDRHFFGGNC